MTTPDPQTRTLIESIMEEVEKFAQLTAPDDHELTTPHIEWIREKLALV